MHRFYSQIFCLLLLFLTFGAKAQQTPILLNDSISSSSNIVEFKVSPDSRRIVYWGDQDSVGLSELYSVSPEGAERVKLNPSLSPSESIDDDFMISADSQRVVFRVLGSPNRLRK